MTDRIHALTVVLEEPIREDDAQALITAIRCLRGVLDVTTHVTDLNTYMARAHAMHLIRDKFLAFYESLDEHTKP